MNSKLILLIILGFTAFSCSDDEPVFLNNWDEDIYYFSKNLKEKHVDLFFNVTETEFDKDIETLRNNSSTYSRQKIIVELTKIISKIGDSHTQLRFGNQLTTLPIGLQLLDDGIFIIEVDEGNEHFLGKRIIEIENLPIEDVLENFRSVISYENESNFKHSVIQHLKFIEFYNVFGIGESSTELVLKTEDESIYIAKTQASETVSLMSDSPPLFLKDTETFYWFEELTEDNILYIQYNACAERNDLPFETFTQQIKSKIDNNSSLTKLVLDLRHNGGGNSTIINPLKEELQNYIDANRFSNNDIFLIVGRKTFSSAVINTIDLKNDLDLVVYGEPTGGKPNHHGEIKLFNLPNSQMTVSYSTKYFEFSSLDPDSFEPDIKVAYNSIHMLNDLDPILDKIINE